MNPPTDVIICHNNHNDESSRLAKDFGPLELEIAGFHHETTLRIIGPAWMVPDLEASWQDLVKRNVILQVTRIVEAEPVPGPRLLAVGRKPAI